VPGAGLVTAREQRARRDEGEVGVAYDEALAGRVRVLLGAEPELGERAMFGGLSFLLGGNVACGVLGEELVVRVGPDAHEEALARPPARPMDFTGRPMAGWVYVAAAGVADEEALREWVEAGTRFAGSLPPKG
jgi:TfoX/Sxy family transcriptional regulator of competence genes